MRCSVKGVNNQDTESSVHANVILISPNVPVNKSQDAVFIKLSKDYNCEYWSNTNIQLYEMSQKRNTI